MPRGRLAEMGQEVLVPVPGSWSFPLAWSCSRAAWWETVAGPCRAPSPFLGGTLPATLPHGPKTGNMKKCSK